MELRKRGLTGGIIGLATLIADHREALNYDLMTRTGAGLGSVPVSLDWSDIRDFVAGLGADSHLVAELHPEVAGWQGDEKVPMLLAAIADQLAALSYSYALVHTKQGAPKPKAPKPIPRPGVEPDRETRRWGTGTSAIPIADFDAWWNAPRD